MSNAVNAEIRDSRGTGTIKNDDERVTNRFTLGDSIDYVSQAFEELKGYWGFSSNQTLVQESELPLFGSINVDSAVELV